MPKNNRKGRRTHLKSTRFDDDSIEILEMYAKEHNCTFSTANIELVKMGFSLWLRNQYTEKD